MSPEDRSSHKNIKNNYTTKKCPFCYVHLPLDAPSCSACNNKVGDVDRLGFAVKPFDWWGYLVAAIFVAGFVVFTWWAFFRE